MAGEIPCQKTAHPFLQPNLAGEMAVANLRHGLPLFSATKSRLHQKLPIPDSLGQKISKLKTLKNGNPNKFRNFELH